MSFSLAAGRILIDKDGATRLNTDDNLAHNLTTNINATISIASQFSNATTSVGFTTDHLVGTCNANCTEVTGSCRISYSTPSSGPQNFSIPIDQWFTVKQGASMWLFMDGEVGSVYAGRNFQPLQYYLYTLRLVSGTIYLRQQVRLPTVSGGTYTVPSQTITLKLKAGLFT